MTRSTRAILAILAFFIVATCLVCGLGAVWVSRNSEALADDMHRIVHEARRWGSSHTESECVDEALRRYRADSGVESMMRAEMFELACLRVASPEPGFCTSVPDRLDLVRIPIWKRIECGRRGFSAYDLGCETIVQGIPEHCATRGRP